jgi:hypothetical protein
MLHGRKYNKRILGVKPPMGRGSGPSMGALLGAGGAFSAQQYTPVPKPAAPPSTTASHEDGSVGAHREFAVPIDRALMPGLASREGLPG